MAILAASGCGGSTAAHHVRHIPFPQGFKAATQELAGVSPAIGQAVQHVPSQPNSQLGATFEGLVRTWHIGLAKLQQLSPPHSMVAPFRALSLAATKVEGDLNAIVAAAQTHNRSAAQTASGHALSDLRTVAFTSREISVLLKHPGSQ